MKPGPYFVVLLLAVACVLLTLALIAMDQANQQLQLQTQTQQQQLNQGILGQQAQQISGSVLQDLAGAAVKNPKIRKLLKKHGYNVSASTPSKSAINLLSEKEIDESTSTATENP
jgi:hypothetical protein